MRLAGILMPVSALPSDYGIGDFGSEAYRFIDISVKAGFKIWQILPLNPLGYGNSPYQPYSSFAGDEIYISPDSLYEDGLLDKAPDKTPASDKIDYQAVRETKHKILRSAYEKFNAERLFESDGYKEFLKFDFVYNYAVFLTLKKKNDLKCWNEWDKEQKDWIKDKKLDLSVYEDDINFEIFVQYIFYTQWIKLKDYANDKGLKIMGDIPIYVGLDSLDVWENQKAFLLNKNGSPKFIAGVPPDYFSKLGQRWGNPIYDWDYMKATDFEFWIKRIEYNSKLYDIIRIDHFRAFDTYWKINARNKTAIKGEWVEAPGYDLFNIIKKKFPKLEIVAEDLGDLRKEVLELRDAFDLKGMRIIQFTYDHEETNDDFEDRENMIAYTGTHDNQTVVGFFNSQDENTKKHIKEFLIRHKYDADKIHKGFIEICVNSLADYAIIPVQDILGLDDNARLNTPGTLNDTNWSFKLKDFDALIESIDYMKELLKKSGRA